MARLRKMSLGRTETAWLAVAALGAVVIAVFFGVKDITTRIDRVERRTTHVTTTRVLPVQMLSASDKSSIRRDVLRIVRAELGRRPRATVVRVRTVSISPQKLGAVVDAAVARGVRRYCEQSLRPCRGEPGVTKTVQVTSTVEEAREPTPASTRPHEVDSSVVDGIDDRVADLERVVDPLRRGLCASPLARVLGLLAICF